MLHRMSKQQNRKNKFFARLFGTIHFDSSEANRVVV